MVLRARGDLFLRDPARNVLQHQLLFGKAEIHNTLPGKWFADCTGGGALAADSTLAAA
jgi:hypothetical protein